MPIIKIEDNSWLIVRRIYLRFSYRQAYVTGRATISGLNIINIVKQFDRCQHIQPERVKLFPGFIS